MTSYSPEMDRELAKIEELLVGVASSSGLLTSATRTRWRWDQPNVIMTWIDHQSGVGRDIQISRSESGLYKIDVNAWKDFDEEEPRRRWLPAQIDGEFSIEQLPEVLKEAYLLVSGWHDKDLKKSAPRSTSST